MDTERPLKGKIACVTGASHGLGAAIARKLWQRGASLIVSARGHAQSDALGKMVENLPVAIDSAQRVYSFYADLSLHSGRVKLADEIEFRGIDILVNNAAIQGPVGLFTDNDVMEWEDTIRVNFLAPVMLMRAALPYMKKNQWGRIINISGGGAANARVEYTAYASSKAALVRFSECLAGEVARDWITVNCIAPGYLGPMGQNREECMEEREAVELCAHLASGASEGVTGCLISAPWDNWRGEGFLSQSKDVNMFKLRRIAP